MDASTLVRRGNNALNVNSVSYPIDITTRGSDWLWAVFSLMAATGLILTVHSHTLPVGKRAFHWFSIAILFTASLAYFSMASNLGKVGVAVEFVRYRSNLFEGSADNAIRSIWYARYIDWTITTPLLLLDLLLATGLPTSTIFFTVFLDLFMIEAGLIGALVESRYKWGFFAFACAAMLYIFYILLVPARSAARSIGADVHKAYVSSAAVLITLWFLYPIAWGLADGGNYITPDSEMVFYGVLDVLAKPGFILLHLWGLRSVEYERFQLQSGHYSVGAIDNNFIRHENNFEKHSPTKPRKQSVKKANGINGHANGDAVTGSNGVPNGNGNIA